MSSFNYVPIPLPCRFGQKPFGNVAVGECFFWKDRIARKDADGNAHFLLLFDEFTLSSETEVEAFEDPPS